MLAAVASRLFPHDPSAPALAEPLSTYIGSKVWPNRAGFRLAIFALQHVGPFVGTPTP